MLHTPTIWRGTAEFGPLRAINNNVDRWRRTLTKIKPTDGQPHVIATPFREMHTRFNNGPVQAHT
jgi:hypothetical protein